MCELLCLSRYLACLIGAFFVAMIPSALLTVLSSRYTDLSADESMAGILLLSYTVPFLIGSVLMYLFAKWLGRSLTILLAAVVSLVGESLLGPVSFIAFDASISVMMVAQTVFGFGAGVWAVVLFPMMQVLAL